MDPAIIKQLPSFVCLVLLFIWLFVVTIVKCITSSRVETSFENNKYDLLLFQMPQQKQQQTSSSSAPFQRKQNRKSAMSRLLIDSNEEEEDNLKYSKLKKNTKIKEENLKACIDAHFNVISLDKFNII